MLHLLLCALALPTVTYLLLYILPYIILFFTPYPNLASRYSASWCVITGGGSGIGESLVEECAAMGLSVVIVTLPCDGNDEMVRRLREKYKDVEFRLVVTKFDVATDYVKAISDATSDLTVQVVFNNAGYISTGFFDGQEIGNVMDNVECNSIACVRITHHFVRKMVKAKVKGCVVFTSSVAGYIPTPFAVTYASTKSFLTQFSQCLSVEVHGLGIDVVVAHPSPVRTRFYDKVEHKIELMEDAKKFATGPRVVAREIIRSVGVFKVRDIGGMAVITRMVVAMVPADVATKGFCYAARFLKDYKVHDGNRRKKIE